MFPDLRPDAKSAPHNHPNLSQKTSQAPFGTCKCFPGAPKGTPKTPKKLPSVTKTSPMIAPGPARTLQNAPQATQGPIWKPSDALRDFSDLKMTFSGFKITFSIFKVTFLKLQIYLFYVEKKMVTLPLPPSHRFFFKLKKLNFKFKKTFRS